MSSQIGRIAVTHATLFAAATTESESVSELLYNETVGIEDCEDGWCRVTSLHDDYPGWISADALTPALPSQTGGETRICVSRQAAGYADPHAGTASLFISYGTPLDIVERVSLDGTARLRDLGGLWFDETDILPPDPARSLCEEARKFLDVPYVWGGRSGWGIDCSGLVQQCCRSRGLDIRRDTSQQVHTTGTAIGSPDRHRPVRDDIVYLPGHVAIALDARTAIHADGLAMHVRIDPLEKIFADRGKSLDQGLIRRL